MIRILNAAQIKEWDEYTIGAEPVHSIDLMERACEAFVAWFVTKFTTYEYVGIVCGTGNNGGDGLGIARLLAARDYNVTVWMIDGNASSDFVSNLSRLGKQVHLQEIKKDINDFNTDFSTVLIDAIFGSGLSRPVEGMYREVVQKFNASKAVKIAVDIPTGLKLDEPSSGDIIRADYTLTFQVPKLSFMFPENAQYVGEWKSVDIDLHSDFLKGNLTGDNYYLDDRSVRGMLRKRKKFSHKGDYGRALIIAGSLGKMGACVLAARAALRSGAGLLTAHVPRCGYDIIQTSVPEAMASIDANEDHFSNVPEAKNYDVIGIGPGLGNTPSTVSGLRAILELGKPTVIDADALNILSENRAMLHLIAAGSILTPHPGEFQRLVGKWTNDFHRLTLQKELARQTKCVVILKGAHTSIASPDGTVYFNSTGNPGMAKGGSGDVLTGVLTGLLSQRYPAITAAIIGVYFHGLAGDLASSSKGEVSMIAGDIVEFMGQSFGH